MLLVSAALHALTRAKKWPRRNATLTTVIVSGLILAVGVVLLLASQSAALGPKPVSPASIPNPSTTPEAGPGATVLSAECPVVSTSDLQVLRIPASEPEDLVTGVLNTYSAWLNAGSELMRLPQWRSAPPQCTKLLASAYGREYETSVFTNEAGAAGLAAIQTQIEQSAQLLDTLRKLDPDASWPLPSNFRVDLVLDTSSNRSDSYLKFEATLIPATAVAWQGADKKARWYVQLIPWNDFYIIHYVEAKVS